MGSSDEAGYTKESLRMLETAEGQTNAVFACFGAAAQHAQLFEQSLSRFLAVYNRMAGSTLSLTDFDSREEKPVKGTMGQLLHRLKDIATFSDEDVLERFALALECRNQLMHSFFLSIGDSMSSEAGRKMLFAFLSGAQDLLDNARITVDAMRSAVCGTLGVDDPYTVATDQPGAPGTKP